MSNDHKANEVYLKCPLNPLLPDLAKSRRRTEILKSDFTSFYFFSVHLPLSNSLEMFHDDVGMKSATTDVFAPRREKQKEKEKKKDAVNILILYHQKSIRNL